MEEGKKPNKRSFIVYYVIIIAVMLVFNVLVYPALMRSQIQQVDYGTFLNDVAAGKVSQVEVQENQIAFKATGEDGKEQIFVTGRMEDPELTKRLYEKGTIKFDKVIPKENSPIVNFILSWILPLAAFFLIGQLIMRQMQKRMGRQRDGVWGKAMPKFM